MARKTAGKEKVRIVLEDEEDRTDIKKGGVERYEVRIGPPTVSGRKVKAHLSPETERGGRPSTASGREAIPVAAATGSSQQIYKIEDDLRRTRDIVEDLRHTVSVLEGEFKDLKGEMERMSYLLRSLEGLRNTMKDIESTVSELSGLYDMISASINPFIDIQPIPPSNGNGAPNRPPASSPEENGEFKDLSEIFDEEEEEEELEEAEEWEDSDLMSDEWALRWTKFLMERVGKEGLERTLDYYKNLGWIDDSIIEKILEIAKGTVGPSRKSDTGKIRWKMDAEDHVRSLEFIRRIKER